MILDAVLLVLAVVLTTAGVRAGLVGPRGRALPVHTAAGGTILAWGLLLPRLAGFAALTDGGLVVVVLATMGTAAGIGFLLGWLAVRGLVRQPASGGTLTRSSAIDSWTGGLAALALLFTALWLWYPVLRALDGGVGDQADDSVLLMTVNRMTRAPLGVVTGPTALIDRFPSIFDARARPPQRGVPPPDSLLDPTLQEQVAGQVVRITGVACNQPTEGSGYVIENGLVLTNAHVVAGHTRSMVHVGGAEREANVVGFDPARDLALLVVSGEPLGPGLSLGTASVGTIGAVFGHPAGRELRVAPFQITDRVTGTGLDIYGEGDVRRKVFFLASELESGDSGAPVVDDVGRVVGIVFAVSPDESQVAFALASSEIGDFLAADHSAPVGPTECR